MSRREFKCFRCGRCCEAGLLIPLTKYDFQEWILNKCYLPIILTVRESNEITDELGLDYIYTVLSHRHTAYKYIREILSMYGIKLPETGCALFNPSYTTCRVYLHRPLVCRIFPFTATLTVYEWARENCEAVKNGYTLPTREIMQIADVYSREIERTYSDKDVLLEIDNLRKLVFEKVLGRLIKERAYLEELRYYLFKHIEYTTVASLSGEE